MENTILKHHYLMIKPRRRHSQSQMSENRVIPPEQEKGKRPLYMQTYMLSIDVTYIWLLISSSIVYSGTHLSCTPLQHLFNFIFSFFEPSLIWLAAPHKQAWTVSRRGFCVRSQNHVTERTILGISPLRDVTQSLEWGKKSQIGTIFTYSEPDLSHTRRWFLSIPSCQTPASLMW